MGRVGIHRNGRCDFCRGFRLFGEKKLVNQCSSVDTVGDNKLSMKCFEINIFFFGRKGFSPLIRSKSTVRISAFISMNEWKRVCVLPLPSLFFTFAARCKNFEELRHARNTTVNY